jgi:hypothetical protein
MLAALHSVLRPNVPYITVNFNDDGLNALGKVDHKKLYPNLLVLSAGGHGHVPIPLFRKHEVQNNHVPVANRTIGINYVGSLRNAPHEMRTHMHQFLEGWAATNVSHWSHLQSPYEYFYGEDWGRYRQTLA